MKISFKAWNKQYTINLDKRKREQEYLRENTNMDNFDLLSEGSDVDLDPDNARNRKEEEEWEY